MKTIFNLLANIVNGRITIDATLKYNFIIGWTECGVAPTSIAVGTSHEMFNARPITRR